MLFVSDKLALAYNLNSYRPICLDAHLVLLVITENKIIDSRLTVLDTILAIVKGNALGWLRLGKSMGLNFTVDKHVSRNMQFLVRKTIRMFQCLRPMDRFFPAPSSINK